MIIIKIKFHVKAPDITLSLKESLELLDNPDDFMLSLQLDYRENSTCIYLDKVECVNFEEYWLTITLKNNSKMYFNYINILEYSIVNAKETKKQGVVDYA